MRKYDFSLYTMCLLFLVSEMQNIGWYIFTKHLTDPFDDFTWKSEVKLAPGSNLRERVKYQFASVDIDEKLHHRSIVNSLLFIRIFFQLTWSIATVTYWSLQWHCIQFIHELLHVFLYLFICTTSVPDKWMSRFTRWRVIPLSGENGLPIFEKKRPGISVTLVYRSPSLLREQEESNLCKV